MPEIGNFLLKLHRLVKLLAHIACVNEPLLALVTLGGAIDIREYIDCSLTQPAGLVLVE